MHPDDDGLNELRLETSIEKHAAELVRVDEVTELVSVLADYNVMMALYTVLHNPSVAPKLDYSHRAMLEKLYSLSQQTNAAVMSYYDDRRDNEE